MLLISAYILAIVCANLSVAFFGPWVSPINSFLLIGLDLALRDKLHDTWQHTGLWPKMFGLIATAGLISYALNPAAGKIAVASVAAFCAAGVVDALIYHRLRRRSFLQRSNASNTAGALVDSLIFPTLAFGALLPHIVALQFLAKVSGGAIWSTIIWNLQKQRV